MAMFGDDYDNELSSSYYSSDDVIHSEPHSNNRYPSIRGVNARRKKKKSRKSKKAHREVDVSKKDKTSQDESNIPSSNSLVLSSSPSHITTMTLQPPAPQPIIEKISLFSHVLIKFELSKYATSTSGIPVCTFDNASLCFYHAVGGTLEKFYFSNGLGQRDVYNEVFFPRDKEYLDVDITDIISVDDCNGYAQHIGKKYHSKPVVHRFLGALFLSCKILNIVTELERSQYFISGSLEYLKKVLGPYLKHGHVTEENKRKILSATTFQEFHETLTHCISHSSVCDI